MKKKFSPLGLHVMEEPLLQSTFVLRQGRRAGPAHSAGADRLSEGSWERAPEVWRSQKGGRLPEDREASGAEHKGELVPLRGRWGAGQLSMPGISPDKVLGSSLPQQSGSCGLRNQICPTTAQTRSGEGQGFRAWPQGRSTCKACSHKVQSHPDLLSQLGR